jgi:hypothetical protein
MELDGFQLQQALREWKAEREILENRFDESLLKFKDEEKESPVEIMARLDKCERAIVKLQQAQNSFNTLTIVEFDGREMFLLEVIKLAGPLGRMERLWREAAREASGGRGHYDRVRERGEDREREQPTMTLDQLQQEARNASRRANACKRAIAIGNSQKRPFNNIGPELLSVSV